MHEGLSFTIRRALAAGVIAFAILGAQGSVALADSSASVLPPEWHVHDGQTLLGPQHKQIGFFATILGSSAATDPAMCPNATDKAFLPSFGSSEASLLRAGVCMTSTKIIDLRTVPLGVAGPDGWTLISGTDGGAWDTYYLVTDR
jgi:hypothetical protein